MLSERAQLLVLSEEMRGKKLQTRLETVGFCVVVKETFLAGLHFVRDVHPDLIVLGSHLRDGTIIEICRRLRQAQCYTPIIVCAEQMDEYDRILALEIGADDYVAETSNIRELIARIRAQLRRVYEFKTFDTDVFHIGNLIIDCTRGQVFRDRHLLDLTPIEFRLLVLLARHHGHVLSRAQIINGVWGYGLQPGDEQIVNVHICRLRQKVEVDSSRPALIVTVPGFGYRLVSSLEHTCRVEKLNPSIFSPLG